MSKKTKLEEAKKDLQRYKDKLRTEDNFEDREFYICGIKNLDDWSSNGWVSRLKNIGNNHSITQISSVGCVPRHRVERILSDPEGYEQEAKKIIVGFKYGNGS